MARLIRSLAIAGAAALLMAACGGGDGGTTPAPTPTPDPAPPATVAQNPCPAPGSTRSSATSPAPGRPGKIADGLGDADPRGTLADVLGRHGAARPSPSASAAGTPTASQDVGEIAVIQDEGDLVTPANRFDIQATGLRYVPKPGGGYDVSRIDAGFRAALGDRVTLGDDDSVSRSMPFGFAFYGTAQTAAFVNSDGNITFGEGDNASTARSLGRLLSGAPRVALFLADLDPSAGGIVFVRAGADAFTTTWCGVPVFGSTRQATMQTSLLPDGSIEMKYADAQRWTAVEGVSGISPGHTGTFQPVDLSAIGSGGVSGNAGAIAERFAERPDLDLVEVSRKFYRTHADAYDQLVIWTDEELTPESAFSFEVNIANDVTGIGLDVFDLSSQFGSVGRLRSVVQMDDVAKFPDDPARKFLGENSTLSVLGQEVGHRWLAFLRFTDHNRERSDALLGRDQAHWSFFFDSDASVMEGNRIEDLGGGAFRTTGAVEKYSLLDQYAMGLVRDVDVPPMFYVDAPTNVQGSGGPESSPRVGVTFSGTRRDVLINDVIEAMGARRPAADGSVKVHRQAFVFVVGRGRSAAAAATGKIERIRRAWDTFFAQATGGRGRAETRLTPQS